MVGNTLGVSIITNINENKFVMVFEQTKCFQINLNFLSMLGKNNRMYSWLMGFRLKNKFVSHRLSGMEIHSDVVCLK